jgi:predicted RND superfamily exporter protein
MWTKIANFILKYRLFLLIILIASTGFMWYAGRNVKITTKFAELVPKHEQDYKTFISFKEHFGQDANAMIVGFQDSSLYQNVDVFNDYYALCNDISSIEGLEPILAIPYIDELKAHKRKRIFYAERVFEGPVKSKKELLTKINRIKDLKLYEGQLFNSSTGASNIYIPFKKSYIDSTTREAMVWEIVALVETFCTKHDIKPNFAGLPHLRTVKTRTTKEELTLFLILSLVVTAIILYLFFRSITTVLFPLLVIATVVVWSKGTIGLLGYEITSLSGLIPTILVVIGIPNAVYLINKFHQEFALHGDKIKALINVIKKIGVVTLITNFTTAIGFLVLVSADITILKEFGVVAGINVFSTFLISIILIPIVFSYLPEPSTKQLKHLDFGLVNGILSKINNTVQHHGKYVYIAAISTVIIASYGVWLVSAVSFMTDDMADDDPTKVSLVFFEEHFKGTLPLEIIIKTGDSTWFKHEENISRINEFEQVLEKQPALSKPLSIVQITKGLRQAYYNGAPQFYDTPSSSEIKAIGEYLIRTKKRAKSKGETTTVSFGGFKDKNSTGQVRISVKCADIGSKELKKLINDVIIPEAQRIFKGVSIKGGEPKDYQIQVTGTSYLFLQGNKFLIQNLKQSLVLAVILIAIIMAFLFKSFRMIIISLVPNIIPLVVTAALMGYFGVPLKPSTALIFSIAFGISVDDSIHFLAKYRQELYMTDFNVKKAISLAIKETGASMMYTSIILFFGFIIFSFSASKSIVMLGVLTSTTLLMAMVTNLIVLPTLLITFDKVSVKKLKSKD